MKRNAALAIAEVRPTGLPHLDADTSVGTQSGPTLSDLQNGGILRPGISFNWDGRATSPDNP